MGIERRKPEASGLRQLFQEQWLHLGRLLGLPSVSDPQATQQHARELAAIDELVEGTNPQLKLVARYRGSLRSGVRALLDHVESLVGKLPSPMHIDPERFCDDLRSAAFFVNKQDIRNIFSRSSELQAFFADPANCRHEQAYAILFMNKVEKKVLGNAMLGDLVVREVPRLSIHFTNHEVSLARSNEAQLRSALQQDLFDRVVQYINASLAGARYAPGGADRPADLDLSRPADYLQHLSQILSRPLEMLKLESNELCMDGMGFAVTQSVQQTTRKIAVQEISLGRHSKTVATLVSYSRHGMRSRQDLYREVLTGLKLGR